MQHQIEHCSLSPRRRCWPAKQAEDLKTDGAQFCENCVQAEIQMWGTHTVDSNTLILTKSGRGMVQALIRKLSARVWWCMTHASGPRVFKELLQHQIEHCSLSPRRRCWPAKQAEDLKTDGAQFCENCVQAEIQMWGTHTVDSNTLILTKSGRGMVQALIRKLSARVWWCMTHASGPRVFKELLQHQIEHCSLSPRHRCWPVTQAGRPKNTWRRIL